MNEDYKLSKIVRLALMKAPSQTIIINGAKQVVNQTYFVMCCPECGRAFKEYDLKRLSVNGRTTCPKCGAKLVK